MLRRTLGSMKRSDASRSIHSCRSASKSTMASGSSCRSLAAGELQVPRGRGEPSAAEHLEVHRGRRAVLEQHIDHLLHGGFGVHIDGTRRRLALHRNGRLIRKATERIGEGFEVGVLGGEHGDEKQADGAAAHAKCLRVRPRMTCEPGKCAVPVNDWFFLFYRVTTRTLWNLVTY